MSINILLVDDSATVRSMIRKMLEASSIEVNSIFEAENGRVALATMKEEWVDLVISDINMPIMTGIEMVEEMCRDGLLKSIPVIVVSVRGDQGEIEYLIETGVKAYLRKPVTPEAIREVVQKAVEASDV